MNKIQALDHFWNSFGVPAYDEGSVPDDAKLPYITYSVAESDFNDPVSLRASIWDRNTSWIRVSDILKLISDEITLGGETIPYDTGVMWLHKGSPFAQRVPDDNGTIRRILMNIEVEYIN